MADYVSKLEESLWQVNLKINNEPNCDFTIDESKTNSTLSENEELLSKFLKILQCPFTWKPENDAGYYCDDLSSISRIKGKAEEIDDEKGEFQWRRYIVQLVIIYEYFKIKDFSSCMEAFEVAEKIVLYSSIDNDNLEFYNAIKDAIYHVLMATKAHLQIYCPTFNKAEFIFPQFKSFDDMDNANKAAIHAIHAAVWMEYGFTGTKNGLDIINKALELDPDRGEWLFLKGKCLGRIRRVASYHEIPSNEELKALEKAADRTKKASHMVFLAQSYREASSRAFSLNKDDLPKLRPILKMMNESALRYYNMALQRKESCSHINARCALGFLKLPHPYKNIELAQKCIDRAYSLSPNNAMINHIAGKIYESKGMIDKALEHYKISGNLGAFGSWMDYIRLVYCKDNTYDPVSDFQMILEKYNEIPLKMELLCQIGSYYMFIKNSFIEAVKFWHMAIDLAPDSEKLKEHRCMFLKMKNPVNIFEILYDEARLLKTQAQSSDEDALCREVISKCQIKVGDLLEKLPLPRKEMVLDEVESNRKMLIRSTLPQNNRGRSSGNRRNFPGNGGRTPSDGQNYNVGSGRRGSCNGTRGYGNRGRGFGDGTRGYGSGGRGFGDGARGYGNGGRGSGDGANAYYNSGRDFSCSVRGFDYRVRGRGSGRGNSNMGKQWWNTNKSEHKNNAQ